MDFNSTGGASKGTMSNNERQALMENLKQQLDVASATELLQSINEKCFKMCVQKPSSSLSSSDQKCLTYCMDRFLDAINIVSRSYGARLQKEMSNLR